MGLHDEPVRMNGRRARTGLPLKPGCGMLFGLPFLGVGVAVILLSLGVIPSDEENFNAPRWVVGVAGGIFAGAGLWMWIASLRNWLRTRGRAAEAALHPDEPWRGDHPWDPEGIRDAPVRKAFAPFVGAAAMAIFTTPFAWVGWAKGETVFAIAAGVMALVVLGILASGVYALLRALKYGRSELRWKRFPFFLGEALEVEFANARGFGRFRSLTLTLRCVEERIETRGDSTAVACYELYADTVRMEEGGEYNAGDGALPLAFPLPAEGRPTALSLHPPVYWELEIEADTPGVDFETRFLVPVYAPPAA